MEKKPILITTDETVLKSELFAVTPRLTPTGKISHAKTRVYTQRYRKEWEQMPDFKGWLTSVESQPTRAFCTYCNKNLHAHRLSLLKHTCTMKHQRAALQHEAQQTKKDGQRKVGAREIIELDDGDDVDALENVEAEMEENEDDIEYVVERLEMEEDDDLDDSQLKHEDEVALQSHEEDENEDPDETEACLRPMSDEEDGKPMTKRMKGRCRDTLAEAMAHVHGEYLGDDESQGHVDLEMVVESEEQTTGEIQMITINQDSEDSITELPKDAREKMTFKRIESKVDTKKLLAINTIPMSKTIALTSDGKTVTLAGSGFKPGAQYVLSKIKGKVPTFLVADNKSQAIAPTDNTQRGIQIKKEPMPVASTSQHSPKKTMKTPLFLKRPRVSTHVVDTSKGLPVGGMQVSLYKLMDGRWTFLNESSTSPSGRCIDLIDSAKVNFTAGRYKLHFDVDKYFTLRRVETIYPFIEIVFDVKNPAGHYHIPILLSPFGYTTYRGSER